MQVKIEEQKRDPRIGKKYIILIYKRIREEVQFPLSPLNSLSKVIKTSKILGISRFFVFTTFQNIHSFSKIKRPHRDPNKNLIFGSR